MHEVFNKDFFWERLIDFFYGTYRSYEGCYHFRLRTQDFFEFYYVTRYFSKIVPSMSARRLNVLSGFKSYYDRNSLRFVYKKSDGIRFYFFSVCEGKGANLGYMRLEIKFTYGKCHKYGFHFRMGCLDKCNVESYP